MILHSLINGWDESPAVAEDKQPHDRHGDACEAGLAALQLVVDELLARRGRELDHGESVLNRPVLSWQELICPGSGWPGSTVTLGTL